jgi:hypothetical protein
VKELIDNCVPKIPHQEFLAFRRRLDDCIPRDLNEHVIVDNYTTHKHSQGAWLARRTRYHIHLLNILDMPRPRLHTMV